MTYIAHHPVLTCFPLPSTSDKDIYNFYHSYTLSINSNNGHERPPNYQACPSGLASSTYRESCLFFFTGLPCMGSFSNVVERSDVSPRCMPSIQCYVRERTAQCTGGCSRRSRSLANIALCRLRPSDRLARLYLIWLLHSLHPDFFLASSPQVIVWEKC